MQKIKFRRNCFSYYRKNPEALYPTHAINIADFLYEEVRSSHKEWLDFFENDSEKEILGNELGLLKENNIVKIMYLVDTELIDDDPFIIPINKLKQLMHQWEEAHSYLVDEIIVFVTNRNEAWIKTVEYQDPEKATIVLERKEKKYTIIQGGKESSLYFLALLLGEDAMNKKLNKKIQRVLKQKKDGAFGYDSLCTIQTHNEKAFISFDNWNTKRGPEFKTTKQKLLKLMEQWNELIKEKPSHVVIKKNCDVISFEIPPEVRV